MLTRPLTVGVAAGVLLLLALPAISQDQATPAAQAHARGMELLAAGDLDAALEAFGEAARAPDATAESKQKFMLVRRIMRTRAGLAREEEEPMSDQPQVLSRQDERLFAALSHVTVLLPFMGILAPVIIWATQKEKSEYVKFHALQALFYQLALILLAVLGWICYFLSFFLSFGGMFLGMFSIPLAAAGGEPENPLLMIIAFLLTMIPIAIPFLTLGLMLILAVFFVVYGIVGAINAMQGNDFTYLFIGKRVLAFLADERGQDSTA